jgi:hypothetical protein
VQFISSRKNPRGLEFRETKFGSFLNAALTQGWALFQEGIIAKLRRASAAVLAEYSYKQSPSGLNKKEESKNLRKLFYVSRQQRCGRAFVSSNSS